MFSVLLPFKIALICCPSHPSDLDWWGQRCKRNCIVKMQRLQHCKPLAFVINSDTEAV